MWVCTSSHTPHCVYYIVWHVQGKWSNETRSSRLPRLQPRKHCQWVPLGMDRVTELHSSNRSRDRRESGLKSSWRTDRQTSSRASLARCARHSRPSPGPKQHCYQAGSVTSATRRMQALESSRKRIRKPRGKGLRTKTGWYVDTIHHRQASRRWGVGRASKFDPRSACFCSLRTWRTILTRFQQA